MDIKNRTYRNVFLELGLSEGEIEDRVEDTFNEIFYGENKFFFMTILPIIFFIIKTFINIL